MRYNDFETMSIYTVENFTSDITVEGYIAEFRDEPHFLELCKQCTNYGKSWGCPPFDFDTESFLRQYKYAHLMATKIIPEDKDIPIEYTQNSFTGTNTNRERIIGYGTEIWRAFICLYR